VCLLEVPSSGIDRDRPPSTVAGARERSGAVEKVLVRAVLSPVPAFVVAALGVVLAQRRRALPPRE
jgi:hypothetical protein